MPAPHLDTAKDFAPVVQHADIHLCSFSSAAQSEKLPESVLLPVT